jgi:hypothetical protein
MSNLKLTSTKVDIYIYIYILNLTTLEMSNLTFSIVMPNDISFLAYSLDLVHELFRVVDTIHLDLLDIFLLLKMR